MVTTVINTRAVVISRPARISIVIKRDRRIINLRKVATGKHRALCNREFIFNLHSFFSSVTRSVILRSIQVVMERASTARRRHTNRLTKARTAIKIRIGRRIKLPSALRSPKAARIKRTRTARNLINTKVPIARRLKISSIPAVTVGQSTKAKIKTGIVRGIRIGNVATNTRAAPADPNTKARTRISTRALARPTKTSPRRLVTIVQLMLNRRLKSRRKRNHQSRIFQ